jgi:hypothetical protein
MTPFLLPPGLTAPPTTTLGAATFCLVLSPLRAPDGQLRMIRTPIAAGQSVAAALPPGQYARVIWNGAVLDEAQQHQVQLRPGDEVLGVPSWGYGTEALLIMFAIGLAVSIATTALTYVLFPPDKPHVTGPDPHTFTFQGIQTAIGPGNIKPIIYGRHRFGGQLLSASVDHFTSVVDSPGGVQRAYATANPPTLTMLVAMGEGPVENIMFPTVEINGQPIANFPGAQLYSRLGTPDQTPIPEFNETRNTFADGRDLPDNSSNTDQQIIYTTTQVVDAFVLNIAWNQGMYHMNGKGDKEDNSVQVSYRYRVNGTGPWTAWSVFEVAAQRMTAVRFAIRKEGVPRAVYDIAINYGAPRHNQEGRSQWQPTLESMTEIQAGISAYPNTALLGLRAVPSDQLQGALPNITAEVLGRRVRVGTFLPIETWTDNPAWCVMDALTNTRYGDAIPDSDIDLAAFAVWAAYCDDLIEGEPRHRFNYILEREGRVQSILLEMMGGSRTLMLKSEGLWTPRPTRNDLPGPLLSWATCSNLKVTYTRDPDRVNVMEARFANEEDGFQQDILVWPTIENWPVEVHKASLEIRTVTKPSRIMRALQYELNRRQFENCIIEFDNALDAVTLQPHDLFRFAHPLPGWGASGRLLEGSTAIHLVLDQYVSMAAGITYQVYLRHSDDTTEARIVFNPGDTTTTVLDFGVPFSRTPVARDTLWAFGTATPDTAARIFRALRVERKSDTTVHIQAVVHNPSIYDEPTAIPVPVPTGLFNPLGPPPPLTSLVATELTRVQTSGASLRVVNLAWNIAGLAAGFAPYGGANVYRRTVFLNSMGGLLEAGAVDLGAISTPGDPQTNFVPLLRVPGNVLEFDDYSVVTGSTYLYRVIPVSGRDIPNVNGGLDVLISVSGPTTADYFPGSIQNLRLRGQAVGVTTWEGRDVHLQWEPVAQSPLFSETFFVQDYVVQVWAPGQGYMLRSTSTPITEFTYTFEMNAEDQVRNAGAGPRRDLLFLVFARTNTGRVSLDPASLLVTNPPPDMSMIIPETTALADTAVIAWNQYFEPRDFDHYELHVDIVNPPIAIYQDIAIAFAGQGSSNRKVFPTGLTPGVTYYSFVLPYDSFGAGIQSQTVSFVPIGFSAEFLDTIPPAVPTGLALRTGTEVSPDGTILSFVQAHWNANTESDLAGYELSFRTSPAPPSGAPTTFLVGRVTQAKLYSVPGNVTIAARIAAFDQLHNVSAFTAEVSILTDADTVPPAMPTNLSARGSFRANVLLWTPPSDLDFFHAQVWGSQTNDRTTAVGLGAGYSDFVHAGLESNATWYYWVRSMDSSGNASPFAPSDMIGIAATTIRTTSADIGNLSITATQIADDAISTPKLQANAVTANKVTTGELITLGAQIRSAIIDDGHIADLSATKITAGTIRANVLLGVANRIFLDGLTPQIVVYDNQTIPIQRVVMGRLGNLTNEWGLRLFNNLGQVMWNFTDGAQTPGIANAAITTAKIAAGQITAELLIADRAVITGAAQIADAIITSAHIIDLTATRITSGVFQGFYFVGGSGRIQMDGVNAQFSVYDENNVRRCILGHLTAFPEGYGMEIYTSTGATMWSFTGGASSLGLQDLAVTRAKIDYAAIGSAQIDTAVIQNAHIENLTVGTGKIQPNAITEYIIVGTAGSGLATGAETEVAAIGFPQLDPNDQVWLVGSATATGGGNGGVPSTLFLREDNAAGTFHNKADGAGTDASSPSFKCSLTVQGVYTAAALQINKRFVLTGTGLGAMTDVRFTGFRRKK